MVFAVGVMLRVWSVRDRPLTVHRATRVLVISILLITLVSYRVRPAIMPIAEISVSGVRDLANIAHPHQSHPV